MSATATTAYRRWSPSAGCMPAARTIRPLAAATTRKADDRSLESHERLTATATRHGEDKRPSDASDDPDDGGVGQSSVDAVHACPPVSRAAHREAAARMDPVLPAAAAGPDARPGPARPGARMTATNAMVPRTAYPAAAGRVVRGDEPPSSRQSKPDPARPLNPERQRFRANSTMTDRRPRAPRVEQIDPREADVDGSGCRDVVAPRGLPGLGAERVGVLDRRGGLLPNVSEGRRTGSLTPVDRDRSIRWSPRAASTIMPDRRKVAAR